MSRSCFVPDPFVRPWPVLGRGADLRGEARHRQRRQLRGGAYRLGRRSRSRQRIGAPPGRRSCGRTMPANRRSSAADARSATPSSTIAGVPSVQKCERWTHVRHGSANRKCVARRGLTDAGLTLVQSCGMILVIQVGRRPMFNKLAVAAAFAVLCGAGVSGQVLLGAAYVGPVGPATLYAIAPATGAALPIGSIGARTESAMALAPNGVVYGVGLTNTCFALLNINTVTGSGPIVGLTGVNEPFHDMDFPPL